MQKLIVVALATALSVAGLSVDVAHADREIVVQPGDSMQSISVRYYGDASHVWDIASYNHLASPDLIYAGLRLVLPGLDPVDRSDGQATPSAANATEGIAASGATGSSSGSAEQPPMPAGAPAAATPTFALPILTTPGSPDAALPGVTTEVVQPAVVIQSGLATWYGPGFNGGITYCGDVYSEWGYTAASNTLGCGTVVVVTNQATGASVRVRVNDRGGFGGSVIMDMSRAAFSAIAPTSAGVVAVTISLPSR